MSAKTVIAVGVTGSIAAYKAADLVSQLVKAGYNVHALMTQNALKLIAAQTFLTLSRNPVITDLWATPDWKPEHIALAEVARLLVVAPCSANFMGKYANGVADDALTTYALSHDAPVLLAPAMNGRMWRNPAVQRNKEILLARGVRFIGPASGSLACGTDGEGRMADVADILTAVREALS